MSSIFARPTHRVPLAALALVGLLSVQHCHGQGIVQRLRARIAPLIAPPQQDAEANDLPARPLPPVGAQLQRTPPTAATPSAAATDPADTPRSNFVRPQGRFGIFSRRGTDPKEGTDPEANKTPTPAVRTPTPAINPSTVRQASSEQPLPARRTEGEPSGLGRSILAPLSFDDSPTDLQPQPAQSERASLGVQAINANPGYPGVQVIRFNAHSAADESGLRTNDYIFAIDGNPTPTIRALSDLLATKRAGDLVRLRIGRDGVVSELDVPLVGSPQPGSSPTSADLPESNVPDPKPEPASISPPKQPSATLSDWKLGAVVRDLTGQRGVIVANVSPKSPAASAGLQPEDRIISINGKMIGNTEDLKSTLAAMGSAPTLKLRIVRRSALLERTLSRESDSTSSPAAMKDTTNADSDAGSSGLFSGLGSAVGIFGSGNTNDTSSDAKVSPEASDTKPQPSGDLPPPAEADDKNQALREEIARLRKQLQSLESKLEE